MSWEGKERGGGQNNGCELFPCVNPSQSRYATHFKSNPFPHLSILTFQPECKNTVPVFNRLTVHTTGTPDTWKLWFLKMTSLWPEGRNSHGLAKITYCNN